MKHQIKKLLIFFISTASLHSCNSQASNSKKSIAEAITTIPNASISETIAYYHKLKKEQPNVYNFDNENELNKVGYQYLNNRNVEGAIEIFKLLVSEFPDSSNAYDSLGEAYLKDNNLELAKVNYQKSLALNPKNGNAENSIFKIDYKTCERPKFDQVFTRHQYLEDIDELVTRITTKHPKPFEFISVIDFTSLVEKQKGKIKDGMSYGEFIWQLSPIIASIGCEHTHLNVFNQEDEMLPVELRFPLEAQLVNTKLLVINPRVNNEIVAIGSSITSINGKTIEEITEDIFKHIASNGHSISLKRKVFSAYITSYIPYYFGFPKSYSITIGNSNKKIDLSQLTSFKYKQINNERSFEIFKDEKTAKLFIPSFNYYGGKRLKDYKAFIDNSFNELKRKGIENLIIDVRRNGGGCSCATIYLLQHIAQKPFRYFDKSSQLPGNKSEADIKYPLDNHFKGNTYILINGFNTSTTGHFLSVVKDQNIATLIGEESGASFYANSATRNHLGANTAVVYNIATKTFFTTAKNLPSNKGVLPDHFVYKTSQDIIEGKDAQLEYVLKLIKKE